MVRRDRNHPSVWMWEPILNETWYPADFAKNVVDILNEEYPYPYCYAGCDVTARGHEYFPIHFTHPITEVEEPLIPKIWIRKSVISPANGEIMWMTGTLTTHQAGSIVAGEKYRC